MCGLKEWRNQDRRQWHLPLIMLGHQAMTKAVDTNEYTTFHYEAAIAAEHLKAATFEATNWNKILMWYEKLYDYQQVACNDERIIR